ncbi:MAG TPA: hypothetical protein VGM39_04610 [Kofleriaceae bacterium]|jgi:hypothetical protein
MAKATHIPEILAHEKHERAMGNVWALLLVIAAVAIVVALALSIR